MSYYQNNKHKLSKYIKLRYHAGGWKKARKYYLLNKARLIENSKKYYQNISDDAHKKRRKYIKDRYIIDVKYNKKINESKKMTKFREIEVKKHFMAQRNL